MHSTDLSKVPHRYAVMLTIHTRLVHPHPFVTEPAAMFYNRVCHFRAKPRRYPCRIKNSDRRADSASIIRRVSRTSDRRSRDFTNKKLSFPDSTEIPLDADHWTPTTVKPFVAEIQVASPIVVKSLSLSATSLTATTLHHSTFAFLASVRLETICVHPYESTVPSPTNHVNVLTLSFSFSPSLTCSLCRTAELNGVRNVATAEEDMHSADPHSLPFSYTIDSSFERNRPLR